MKMNDMRPGITGGFLLLMALLLTLVSCSGDADPANSAATGPDTAATDAASAPPTAALESVGRADVRRQQQQMLEAYIEGLNSAADAEDVAQTIREYTRRLQELAPLLKPGAAQSAASGETDVLPDNFDLLTERLLNATLKAERFADDPEVQAAQAELRRVQMELE
ncbi:MAG: hypothetical protein JXQ27_00665 [Acidobacteria bacterium]|nr:hypothetical protein [Acidobacteriota bacterium]